MDLRESLARTFWRGSPPPVVQKGRWALRHVNFEVEPNDIVGILGDNGSGKTTLLKILSRISQPTEGYAEICGRVGALFDGGAGFHAELTGRENVFLLASLLGMKRLDDQRTFEAIVAFADLETSIDTPLKYYSSGMCVRLAFAVAAHLDAEILLVDEVLAVADRDYQKKSLEKMIALSERRRTVLFVSHDLPYVRQLCRHAIVFSEGRVVHFGSASEAVDFYRSISTCRPARESSDRRSTDLGRKIPCVVPPSGR